MKNINKRIATILAGTTIISGLALALPAFAQWQGRTGGTPGMTRGTPPAAFGSVTAVNGTTLTITSHPFVRPASTSNGTAPVAPAASTAVTTYTVNASNATVMKNNATSTVSAIAVGDTVVIQGTVSGTNITATSIRDGVMTRGAGGMKPGAVNGTAVTASSVIDQKAPAPAATNGSKMSPQKNLGFFGSIGNFFSKIFGF